MIEEGDVNVLVVAYFDRLVRGLSRQSEILERVERSGGSVLTVDLGEIKTDTASAWLTSTAHGMMAEYVRRMSGERAHEGKQQAIDRASGTPAPSERGTCRAVEPRLLGSGRVEEIRAWGDPFELTTRNIYEAAWGNDREVNARWRQRTPATRTTRDRRAAVVLHLCGATADLTADHVTPIAAGGHPLGQLRTMCRSCNSGRGAGNRET
jgi:5-methylcytosine-specific restriction endonuclease McrA